MVLASHRTWSVAAAVALSALLVVQGCSKLAARRQAAQRQKQPAMDETVAAPTTQPTTDAVAEATTQESETTADATPPPTDPPQPAAPTTQPTADREQADPLAEAAPATQPADAAATQPAAASAPATRLADAPNPALAERFAMMAQEPLRVPLVVEQSWRASAALLEAATRLHPTEPRFARLLVEARSRAGNIPGAIQALAAYRRLAPGDQLAQVRQIDLYLTRMETADAKVKYLESLIGAEDAIAPEVRAHAAVRAAQTMVERSQPQRAEEMLAKALELNPLNIDALRLRLTTSAQAAPEQRVAMAVALLRATPTDPAVAARLARELGAAGLHRAALEWYASGLRMYARVGTAPDPQFLTDYVATLVFAGATNDAEALLTQMLRNDSSDINAWTLRLVMARDSGDKDKFATALRQANVALANRIAMIRQAAGDKTATTRPIDSPAEALPEPAPILQQLSATGRNDLLQAFAETAAAAAWMKIYFEQKPTEAVPWVGILRQMLGEQNPLVARLEGWSFLGVDRPDEARVKFSAVADRDPLAAMGMIKAAAPADKERADADARRLLSQYPSGVMGALLAEGLRDRKIEPPPAADAEAVAAALDTFPKDFIRIIDTPGLFYSVRMEPLKVTHAYSEPLLVRVAVQNVGRDSITLGTEGAIKPDLWFDAQLRGVDQHPFPHIAFDRLAGPLVLQPGQSTSQVVRLDQGQLYELLQTNPIPTRQVSGFVTTNPTMTQQGIAPGLAGVRVSLQRLMQRSGSPLNDQFRQRVLQATSEGTPEEKVRTVQLLGVLAKGLSREEADENSKAAAGQFRDLLARAMRDPEPSVAAWAGYMSVLNAAPPEQGELLERMSEGDWMRRMFVVALVQSGVGPIELPARLAKSDEDPLVRNYATAIVELQQIATTRPSATQPAATRPAGAVTQPATAPVTSSAPPAAR